MRNRVDAGDGADARRLGDRHFGVEDGGTERGLAVAAGHFQVALLVGDQRVGLGLAAGAGGGGHGDGRQHRLGGLAEAAVVGHLAAVGQDEVDALGTVHRAAAADADDQVDAQRPREDDAGLHVPVSRVRFDVVEDEDLQARLADRLDGALRVAGGFEAGIGDQEDARLAQLAGHLAEPGERAGAVDDPRRRVVIKRAQWPHRDGMVNRRRGRGHCHTTASRKNSPQRHKEHKEEMPRLEQDRISGFPLHFLFVLFVSLW